MEVDTGNEVQKRGEQGWYRRRGLVSRMALRKGFLEHFIHLKHLPLMIH